MPCLYDQECQDGHICYQNRYCYKLPTVLKAGKQIPTCNQTETYSFRDRKTLRVSEVSSTNRCMGVKCGGDSDCGVSYQCRDGNCNKPPKMAVTAVAVTGVASLTCGLVLGYLISYCRMRNNQLKAGQQNTENLSSKENSIKNRVSINQDLKMSERTSSDGEDDDRNRGVRLLKY